MKGPKFCRGHEREPENNSRWNMRRAAECQMCWENKERSNTHDFKHEHRVSLYPPLKNIYAASLNKSTGKPSQKLRDTWRMCFHQYWSKSFCHTPNYVTWQWFFTSRVDLLKCSLTTARPTTSQGEVMIKHFSRVWVIRGGLNQRQLKHLHVSTTSSSCSRFNPPWMILMVNKLWQLIV